LTYEYGDILREKPQSSPPHLLSGYFTAREAFTPIPFSPIPLATPFSTKLYHPMYEGFSKAEMIPDMNDVYAGRYNLDQSQLA